MALGDGIQVLPGAAKGFTGLQPVGEAAGTGIGGIGGLNPGLAGIGSGLTTALTGGSFTESAGSGLGAAIGAVAGGPIGAVVGSAFGSFAGGLFGGGGGHPVDFSGLTIPENLSDFGIVSTPVSRGSFKHAGESSATITDSIHLTYNQVAERFAKLGFRIPTELKDITALPHSIAAEGVPNPVDEFGREQPLTPEQAFQERQNMNQQSINLLSRAMSVLEELEKGNKPFIDLYNSNPSVQFLMDEYAKQTPIEKTGINLPKINLPGSNLGLNLLGSGGGGNTIIQQQLPQQEQLLTGIQRKAKTIRAEEKDFNRGLISFPLPSRGLL